jgi:hypothetical protein
MNRKQIIILCFIQLVSITKLFCQDVLDYSNSLKYANYLFQSKQYQFSAIEYERVTYLEPTDTLAKLRLIQSYRLMNDLPNAKARLEKYYPGSILNYPEKFAVEKIKLFFLEKQYSDAYSFLQENSTIELSKRTEYKLGSLLMQNNWAEAKSLTDDYLLSYQKTPAIDDLYKIALKGIQIKYKRPYCAALLSAIIPGSGKIYTNQWKDGIYAFLFISAISCLTYNSINHNGFNTGSILYGSVALSFYAANIYGSFISAGRYNQKKNRNLTKDIENILGE